jgi:Ner family transcriptional regulator
MLTTQRPKEPHLLREWVKYQLRLKGITFTSLANKYGGGRELPCRAFTQRSPKWEKIIADAMLMMPEELWPERYVKTSGCKSTRKRRGAQ